ncbi:MAG: hypothetical protein VW380_01380 [Candidatus Woesearchaeota archaeon]
MIDLILLVIASSILIFTISIGVIKKEDIGPHYYHLDSRGRIKGFEDTEESRKKDTYVLIRPTLSDTYGNGLIDGIMEYGKLPKVREDLNEIIRHRRVIRRALGNFGGWRIKKEDLNEKVNSMKMDYLSLNERERANILIQKIPDDHKRILENLSKLPGPSKINSFQNNISNVVTVGIIDGLTDEEIINRINFESSKILLN